ncbi:MAG TPA: OmpA family protein [Verrucomicrobiae bacterium]|nr:OmpA family protein [Verrucomicrobiae bacterium]
MKMTKLIYPLAFALAITLASTGCHNRQVKVTPIPGSKTGMPGYAGGGDTRPTTGGTFDPNAGGGVGTGGGQLAGLDEFEGMIKDPSALAAYTVHFGFDSAVIKSSEKSNLEAVAAALKGDPNTKLLVEGNCDDRGTEEYNRSLGERRALAAREALAKDGVDPARIRTISYGKDKPADPGHDEAAWAKNRRDDFVLLHPKP